MKILVIGGKGAFGAPFGPRWARGTIASRAAPVVATFYHLQAEFTDEITGVKAGKVTHRGQHWRQRRFRRNTSFRPATRPSGSM